MTNVIRFQVPESKQLEQAFADWLSRRAYLGNGGLYRLHNATGRDPVAPWNKLVKRTFTEQRVYGETVVTLHDNFGFHDAAHAWQEAR